jgi:pimeloyl-ACP methyl ester carboxylesterase
MTDSRSAPAINQEGQTEIINGITFTHRFRRAGGVSWHYVETGAQGAEPVFFLHGAPESWYSWHYQMEALAPSFHSIAIDMKGYGQTEKTDDSYQLQFIAEQISALLAAIGIPNYNLVTHDWGTMVGDQLAGIDHNKVLRYLRMEGWVMDQDTANVPHVKLLKDNQELAVSMMSNAEIFVSGIYQRNTLHPIPGPDLQRIISEFSRDGVAQAVPRYFRDLDFSMGSEEGLKKRREMFSAMTFPVLLLQGDHDPLQPQRIFQGATAFFPDATLQWVKDSGHFTQLEQPQQVSQAMLDFIANKPL